MSMVNVPSGGANALAAAIRRLVRDLDGLYRGLLAAKRRV
jgi:hypothetical protein